MGSGGPLGPYWDFGGPGAAAGPGGWTVQAGVFPFPGLSMGWTGGTRPVHIAGPAGMRMTMGPAAAAGMGHGAILTPEMQEAARRQQRNALIAFVVMIILFSLRESRALSFFRLVDVSILQVHRADHCSGFISLINLRW